MKEVEPNVKNYDEFCKNFKWNIPEYYNFAFDEVDKKAEENDKVALITVSSDGEEAVEHRFSDLRSLSNKFANVLKKYGVKKG
ncbi:MAG: acyl-CoA synthetase, partial [Thermoplasmata archaeon]